MKITVIQYCSYFRKDHFSKIFKKQNWRKSSVGPMIRTQAFHRSILSSIPDWGSKITHPAVPSILKGKKKKKRKKERKMNNLAL